MPFTVAHLTLIKVATDLITDLIEIIRQTGDMSEEEARDKIPEVEAKREELMKRLRSH